MPCQALSILSFIQFSRLLIRRIRSLHGPDRRMHAARDHLLPGESKSAQLSARISYFGTALDNSPDAILGIYFRDLGLPAELF